MKRGAAAAAILVAGLALAACTSGGGGSNGSPVASPSPTVCPLVAIYIPQLYPAPGATAVPTAPAIVVVGLPSGAAYTTLNLTASGTTQSYPLSAATSPLPVPAATSLPAGYSAYAATPQLAAGTTYTATLSGAPATSIGCPSDAGLAGFSTR